MVVRSKLNRCFNNIEPGERVGKVNISLVVLKPLKYYCADGIFYFRQGSGKKVVPCFIINTELNIVCVNCFSFVMSYGKRDLRKRVLRGKLPSIFFFQYPPLGDGNNIVAGLNIQSKFRKISV
ncbi:hypothetical protein ES708_29733 [subsurface metagenome]